MSFELVFFLLFAFGAVVTSVLVISLRNPIGSAISLVGTFLFIAGIYALLNATFMAVIQVMVYAGAIMVLFLFVIMLLNLGDDELGDRRITFTKGVSALAAAGMFVAFVSGIVTLEDQPPVLADDSTVGKTVSSVVETLYGPAEVARVLPLTRVNGAVVSGDHEVQKGDILTFGTTKFAGLVRYADPPSKQELLRLGAVGPDALPAREAATLRAKARKWEEFGSIEKVGQSLYTKWVFAFEITGILLLAAVVGAVIIAKRRI